MKKILATFAGLALAFSASAQSYIFENPDNAPYFGTRLGIDISSASEGYGEYSNGFGFHFGAIYNIPVYKNLYFEPGLSIFYNTIGDQVLSMDPDIVEDALTFYEGSIRNFGFRIPLMFGYRFDFTEDISLSVFTGPQLNISLTAKDHWEKKELEIGSLFGEYGFKPLDAQWGFGMSVGVKNYYVAFSGGVGMTDLYSKTFPVLGKRNFKRNTVSITVGYNF